MTTEAEEQGTTPRLVSANVIREELLFEIATQEKRADTAETRAGLIIGFAGAAGAVAFAHHTWLTAFGLVAAVAAALLAVRVLSPQLHRSLDPQAFRDRWGAAPEDVSRQVAIDTRIENYRENQRLVDKKYEHLKQALRALSVAIMLILADGALATVQDLLAQS